MNLSGRETTDANFDLVCALAHEIDPQSVCLGSIAKGQLGTQKISLRLWNAKIYEIIDAIVAQNGKSAWTVIAPPSRLTGTDLRDLWRIYPLQAPFKDAVLDKLSSPRFVGRHYNITF